ncbi:MAG: homoserine dehydrogenase [Nitrospirae bacterium]|nr:homoserine dehydrogenase [Nitrospirota bacterium]
MKSVKVVLIGLGRGGRRFYEKFRLLGEDRIKRLAVFETAFDYPPADRIKRDHIPFCAHYKVALTRLGTEKDIIRDATTVPEVKNDLRHLFQKSGNHPTVLAPLAVSCLSWPISDPREELVQDPKDPGT